MSFEVELNALLVESEGYTTPEEHLAGVRKLQKLFSDNHNEAHRIGVETSASYRDNEAHQILERAENGGINTYTIAPYWEWLPSSWDQC